MSTDAKLKLVEVHGQKLTTTTLIIAEQCKVKHESTIKLARKFKSDLEDVGRVGFEIRSFQTNGGVQDQEIAVLDDYAAMLLLTHMRSNEVVRKFKLELVREFKRMRRILSEPGRKSELAAKRSTGSEMTDMLQFVRESAGKKTTKGHCIGEHMFCNRALTGKWAAISEADLDVYDTRLLAAIRKRNMLLMTRYPKQADRKKLMDDFVSQYRANHPRLALVA
ncbi:Rha family transcriptional regulator [Methylomonas sp. OY6]|uniref:Rha family transcriptional regulator n=1 Tax=Methylomonas defluvii TaxID=3045149 RepID=A0ABU4UEW5_9GAMM|nr:Rha family transcriptional regulator [Methylomonas sp. OY6]MDX8127987.1 Rha family transcriptional regulator [Methylomonas sp. OY6]